jgi:hypothetical protein
LLLEYGADITVKGAGAALHEAATRFDTEMLKLLLDRGADPEEPYSDSGTNSYVWCLNRGHQHYIFDDIFHRIPLIGFQTRDIAVLLRFLLGYKPESFPSMPRLALIAAGRNGRPDDIRLIFDNCQIGPEVLLDVLEMLKWSFENVEGENAADEGADEDGAGKDLIGTIDDTEALWRPISISGWINPCVFDNIRLLRERLASMQMTRSSMDNNNNS